LTTTVDQIKELRELSGAGIMDCKLALEEAGGDLEAAQRILKEKGVASAAKKASRDTNEGLVESYIHGGGRVGALVELNCETDFVARTDDMKSLAHNLAMQVAAMAPAYLDKADIPEGEDLDPREVCLLQQSFIREPDQTVQDLVNAAVGILGENIRVRRFSRFALGE
jgi:elongation factor Ts